MSNEITLDAVKNFLETNEEGRKWLQSHSDAKVTKAISTWKENNLQNLVDEQVKELYPDEDPKDKEIKKLSLELEKMKNQSIITELTSEVVKLATEKKIPVEIAKMLVTSDKDKTNENIQILEESWNGALKEQIKNNLNSSTPTFSSSSNGITIESFRNMSYQEKKALKQSSPELYDSLTQ